MASLALMVSLIFLSVVFSGPVSILLENLDMPVMASILATFAIFSGLYWFCVAPFPISMIGIMSAVCGVITFSKI